MVATAVLENKLAASAVVGIAIVLAAHLSVRKANSGRRAMGLAPQHPPYMRIFLIAAGAAYGILYVWSQTPSSKKGGGGIAMSADHGGMIRMEDLLDNIDLGDPVF
jgi:hypothetical protein